MSKQLSRIPTCIPMHIYIYTQYMILYTHITVITYSILYDFCYHILLISINTITIIHMITSLPHQKPRPSDEDVQHQPPVIDPPGSVGILSDC